MSSAVSASRVVTLTVVDQGASSVSNFALAVLVAHYSGARALGLFALLATTYILSQGLVRSVTSDCLLTRSGTAGGVLARSERAGYLAAGICASGLALGLAVVAVALGPLFGVPLALFALCFPAMALQDFSRFIGISRYDPAYAIRLDVAWLVLFVAAFVGLRSAHLVSLPWLWGAWTASGAAVGLTTLPAHGTRRGARRLLRFWVERERAVGLRFAGQFMLVNSWSYFIFYLLALVVSIQAVGQVKLAQLAIGPLTVLGSGVQSALVAVAAQRFRSDHRRAMGLLRTAATLTALATAAWTAVVYLLPPHLMSVALGPTWPEARRLVPAIGLGFAVGVVSAAASAGLRALRAARENLWLAVACLPLWFVPCMVGAAEWGAKGFSFGFVLAFALSSVLGWVVLRRAERARRGAAGEGAAVTATGAVAAGEVTEAAEAAVVAEVVETALVRRPAGVPDVTTNVRPDRGRVGATVSTVDFMAQDSSLREYLRLLWRRRWVVVGVTAVVVLAGIGYVVTSPRVYRGTADLLLTPQLSPALLEANNAENPAITVDVPSDIEIIESASVADLVRRTVPDAPPVTAAQVGTTNVVTVSTESSDPRLAARAATAYARAYITQQQTQTAAALSGASHLVQHRLNAVEATISTVSAELAGASSQVDASGLESELAVLQGSLQQEAAQLQSQLTNYEYYSAASGGESGRIISAATVPAKPSKPNPPEILVLALLLGLVLGVGAAMALEFFDDGIRSTEDLERVAANRPVLGLIPVDPDGAGAGRLAAVEAPDSPAAEAYRNLRTSLQFVGLERAIKTVQVTSPGGAEGKTTTLANLAVVTAQAGYRVVVADCDLRRPSLHAHFGLENQVGLTSVLLGEVSLGAALQRVPGFENLQVLASGPVPPNPSELLASARAAAVVRRLAAEADIVLIDSPPVLPLSDAAELAGRVDAAIVVVQVGTTTRHQLARALQLLGQVEAPVLGVALNRVAESTTLADSLSPLVARRSRGEQRTTVDRQRVSVGTG